MNFWGPHKTQRQSALMREQQHLTSCRGGHVSEQQVRSQTLISAVWGSFKDPTLEYQGADGAHWLPSVILAAAEPLCVCVRSLLRSGSRWEANMALALLLERSLCLPLQAAGGSIGEAILTLPKHGATSSLSSSSSGLVTATQPEIHNPVTGGCSQVCTVPLSISKEPEYKVLYVQHQEGRVFPVWCLLESHKRSCWGLTWSVTHDPISAEYSQLSFPVGK